MIRSLVSSDLPLILKLFAQLGGEHRGWSQRIDEKWFVGELKFGQGLGSFAEGGLQAMLFYRLQPEIVEITYIMVAPALAGQGLGGRLLKHYLTEIVGQRELWLEVHEENRAALAFYGKWGFVESGRRPRYYPDGGAAICLVRR